MSTNEPISKREPRVMLSFRVGRAGKAAVTRVAKELGKDRSEWLREVVAAAVQEHDRKKRMGRR